MSGALCEEVSGSQVGGFMKYLYLDVESYDGGVTSAPAYMYYDCVCKNH